jgi:hypothetical protein
MRRLRSGKGAQQVPFDFAQAGSRLPPDFLLRLVALAKLKRLSLLKAAHAGVGECRVTGSPGSRRFRMTILWES